MFVLLWSLIEKVQGDQILGFFVYLLFLGIVRKIALKLDNALDSKEGELCLRKKKLWQKHAFFPASYRRAFHWTWITDQQNSLQVHRLKFQIGIVPFSLCLSCQIMVHRLGWAESRIWKGTFFVIGKGLVSTTALARDVIRFSDLFSFLFPTSSAFHCFKGES